MRYALVVAAAVTGFAIACACSPSFDAPLSVAPTKDYPCGIHGVVCPGKMCCAEEETCGGAFPSVGCPAGECCFLGVEAKRSGDAGAEDHLRHPQTPASQ